MYRCNIGFTSIHRGKYYPYGSEITESELMTLSENERRYFIKSRTSNLGSSGYNATPLQSSWEDTPQRSSFLDSTPDYGSSSSSDSDSSSNDFGGFDGGDGGGAGASGDW